MIRRINEAKTSIKHVSCDFLVNVNLILKHVILTKNGIMIKVNVDVKSISHEEEVKVGILAHVFVRKVGI